MAKWYVNGAEMSIEELQYADQAQAIETRLGHDFGFGALIVHTPKFAAWNVYYYVNGRRIFADSVSSQSEAIRIVSNAMEAVKRAAAEDAEQVGDA